MLSSCGSGICRKELPLKIANISVYNVGDAASVPCPLFCENTGEESGAAPNQAAQQVEYVKRKGEESTGENIRKMEYWKVQSATAAERSWW